VRNVGEVVVWCSAVCSVCGVKRVRGGSGVVVVVWQQCEGISSGVWCGVVQCGVQCSVHNGMNVVGHTHWVRRWSTGNGTEGWLAAG